MGPVLKSLIGLQSIENRLRIVKAKLARCRRNVIIQENQIRGLQNSFEAKKEEIQLTRVQSDRLELELASKEEHITKLRSSLNAAKTNKEYAALLTQLNITKADNSKIESQVLEMMKDIEVDEAECRSTAEQIEQQKQKLDQIRKDSEQLAEKYEDDIHRIQTEWDEKAGAIPAELLEIFKRVAETYDGEALAVIEEQQARDTSYTCGGCFMGVPAELLNLLMTRDDIIRCPNCTRILVLEQAQD